MAGYAFEQLGEIDTILAGRVTYEGMAGHWPQAAGDPGSSLQEQAFAERMNKLPKVIFSRTLEKAEWNNSRIVKDNIPEEILRMKQEAGKDMIIWGGAGIVSTFVKLGLIDEYRFCIAPVIIGRGMPFSKEVRKNMSLRLVKAKTFSNGVLLLYYRPEKNNAGNL
jgi:dihydrofolate reductase